MGHWEGDLVQYQRQSENLLTMQERKTRLVLIAKNPSKQGLFDQRPEKV